MLNFFSTSTHVDYLDYAIQMPKRVESEVENKEKNYSCFPMVAFSLRFVRHWLPFCSQVPITTVRIKSLVERSNANVKRDSIPNPR